MTLARRHWLTRTAAAATLAGCLAAGLIGPAFAQGSKALNIALFPEPPSVLAGWGSTGPAQMVNGNIYDSLLRYDEKLQPSPSLATEWTVSKDHLTYTFKLKQGVTWHDGKPFTADDVVFTADVFMRALNPRVRVALQSVKSITALDPMTVEFQLSHPFAPFLGMFDTSTMPIVPKHVYAGVDLSKPPAGQVPIGTGPYKFKAWERGSFIQLEKNPSYHTAGLPKIASVYFHVIPDAASRSAAFESGKVDVLPGGTVEYFDVPRLTKLPGVSVTTKGWEKFAPLSWLWMNHRQPLFQDLRVRQAVLHALDREAIAKVVWQGYAKPATGPWNRLTPFHTDKTQVYPHDPAKARKLLAEAGYKGQPVRLLGLPFGETWARMAEMMKQHLIRGGFNIELVSADLPGVMKRQATWDFDLATTFIYQYGDPALGISRNYVGSEIKQGAPFNNVGGYQSAKVDALFELASRESDDAKRSAMYADIQRTLVDDAAQAWLLDLNFPTVYRSSIDNLVNSGLGLNDSLARASFR